MTHKACVTGLILGRLSGELALGSGRSTQGAYDISEVKFGAVELWTVGRYRSEHFDYQSHGSKRQGDESQSAWHGPEVTWWGTLCLSLVSGAGTVIIRPHSREGGGH